MLSKARLGLLFNALTKHPHDTHFNYLCSNYSSFNLIILHASCCICSNSIWIALMISSFSFKSDYSSAMMSYGFAFLSILLVMLFVLMVADIILDDSAKLETVSFKLLLTNSCFITLIIIVLFS